MSVFNSLGSNYDLLFALKSLFSFGNKNLKGYLEKKYGGKATLFYKGREAITFALASMNFPKGSEALINGLTCYVVYRGIEEAGLKPVLVDLPKDDLNFSADVLKKKISKNTKAVIIQNTLGYPSDALEIAKICKENNLVLIEDLAHCVGAKYKGKKEAGSLGEILILSFSQDKITDGVSGGAVVFKNGKSPMVNSKWANLSFPNQLKDRLYPLLTWKVRFLYNFGLGKPYHLLIKSLNLLSNPMDDALYGFIKMPSLSQTLALDAFENLEDNLRHREKIAKIYAKNLPSHLLLPNINEKTYDSSNLRFPIFMGDRDKFIKYLKSKGFYLSDIWYDAPVAPKRFMDKINYNGQCPNTETISEKIINLPTHKNISEEQALFLCKLINLWTGEEKGIAKHV